MSDAAPYLATVVAHYRRPNNQRTLASPTHVHEGVNALCGDRVRIELALLEGQVVDVSFAASACAIATASASILTERIRGGPVADALAVDEDAMLAALGAGIPAARRGCVVLPLTVLRQALAGAA